MGGHREKVPSADQEGGHRRNKDTLAPSSWASQPPELGERNVCCLEATWSLYFVIGPKWAETGNAQLSPASLRENQLGQDGGREPNGGKRRIWGPD